MTKNELDEKTQQTNDLDELKKLCSHHLGAEVSGDEKLVFGEGPADAEIMFIGEAPGTQEARAGRPFVGNAGKLLNKLIKDIGLEREQVYIANILKTHPPDNRKPTRSEIKAQLPFLRRQIELIHPKLLVLLGATALQGLVDPKARITQERGNWIEVDGIPALVTFHPAAVFRDESKRAMLEADFKKLQQRLGG